MTTALPNPSNETTYPAKFAGPRRDSLIHAPSRLSGAVGWAQDLPKEGAPWRDLLIWNGQVLAVGRNSIALHDKNGDRLWERGRMPGSPVALGNGKVYLETGSYFLQAVGASNEVVLDDAPLPGISGNETVLNLLWPRQEDFIVASTMPDPNYDSEAPGPPPEPIISGFRVTYGSRMGAWGEDYEGTLTLPPLFVPEISRWIVSTDSQVISVNVDTAEDTRFKLAIDKALNWSADPTGLIAVLGTQQGRKVLLATSALGVSAWRFVDERQEDSWVAGQPPIGAAKGRLAALTSSRVLAFDSGKLVWQFDLGSDAQHRASMLEDKSLLVVSGPKLRAISASGEERFSLTLPADIVTSPVADAGGTIYVATADQLFAIR